MHSSVGAQVLGVAWVTATAFFLLVYSAPCLKLPPPERLAWFEMGGNDQDIFAGGDDADARGLKHFPRLWCGGMHLASGGLTARREHLLACAPCHACAGDWP